jgi:mannose-6-phosphate isomerase-like protein (cupin superfamily)
MMAHMTDLEAHQLADVTARHAAAGQPYLEFLRRPELSVGLYVLPAGGVDGQTSHNEDEVYVVVSGSATLTVGTETTAVREGSVAFVAKHVDHRFTDVTGDFRTLVFFAPADSKV